MYTLEFLPIATLDINNIVYYISHNLNNNKAARELIKTFNKSFYNIVEFPYGCSIYSPTKKLKNDYRSYKVKNFHMFYTINEKTKAITIVRVLYQRMDLNEILK